MTTTTLIATLVGGPTVHLAWAGRSLLTDPTFDPAPREYVGRVPLHKLVGPAVPADALGPLDAVLLSHDEHADNLDAAGRALLARVPLVLSTPGAAERVGGVTGLEPWQTVALAGPRRARVTAVPALHGSPGAQAVTGDVTGFVLEGEGAATVYVSGDNASVDIVGQVVERFRVDVAVLFVGGARVGAPALEPLTLDAPLAVAAARLLPDARLLPAHHTDWAHFAEPLDAVVEALVADGHGDRLVVLERGRPTQV
ncbi:beta-lactamase fold-like Zn-dependent hydrolase [Cellulomonas flavigena DSM 20109]|uniref:Beta-lactamase fold-like Zn-dependent hydrolase n=1 Tax=Cellulomonas flavigena (strain ATCC 482 / DSM 20109 / BCRC 11376 / JCM 18109 / NBRC 3775 / NCIMB 8073 / NRS 134) TaxID=446466 RepID=D5UD93_CELFN|nr:MBL fold metallo-hydrolase [Cellulomonas flavigena]ADG74430.1 beta-lactamase fold-like Zn-dependent hydrolase [Cellulomonas flavigena DSM 20109]